MGKWRPNSDTSQWLSLSSAPDALRQALSPLRVMFCFASAAATVLMYSAPNTVVTDE